MSQVSRPFQLALVAAVAALAIWLVALKPSSSSSSGATQPSTNTFASGVLSAPGKARAAVAASNAASAAHGGAIATTPGGPVPTATTPAAATPTTKPPGATTPPATAATPPAAAIRAQQRATAPAHSPTAKRLDLVSRALKANKVLALLFYNSAAPDDRAVRDELAAVPLAGGKVVRLAVPIKELGRYPVVTTQVPVNSSPTLVIINPHQQATTIVGFADGFEIAQRIADAARII